MMADQQCESQVILIDCDAGVDDLSAILMAFSQAPQVNVVGITCVNGNVDIDKVVLNSMRSLKLCDAIGKVPVFRGCKSPLFPEPEFERGYHGSDGLGDVPELEPVPDKDWLNHVEDEHAANAIVRLAKKHEGKLKLIAIGPLTNLAVAVKLDPNLSSRLHSLHIMGGTTCGMGNVAMTSEFNFYLDPEAARIVLHDFSEKCHVQVTPLETCSQHAVPKDWHDAWLKNADTPKGSFFREAYKVLGGFQTLYPLHPAKNCLGYCIYDSYTMCTALKPEAVLKASKVRVCVEVGGLVSRGNMLLDHRNRGGVHLTPSPVTIVERIDMELYKSMLVTSLQ